MAVCTPTTAVQGQGSINVAYLRQESQQVTTAYGERTNLADIYAFTASPATGWAFDHFEIVTTYDHGSYVETPDETHTIETSSSPLPITDNPFQTVGLATQTIADYHSVGEYYGTGRYRSTYKTLTYTVTAVFVQAPTTYTITTTSSPVGGGTTTGGRSYSSGASCTLTATPASGYSFVRWEKSGAQVSTSASYTFTVSESATYTAIFEQVAPVTYTITTAVKPAGAGTATGGGTYTSGTTATITATANRGYGFSRWELNGVSVSTSATYSFVVSGDATYTAVFVPGVLISAAVYGRGLGTVSINSGTPGRTVSGMFFPGDTVTLDAFPEDPEWDCFDHWIIGSDWEHAPAIPGAGAHYQITITASAHYGAVMGVYPFFTVRATTETSYGGTVSIDGGTAGTDVRKAIKLNASQYAISLSASPTGSTPGYRFARWAYGSPTGETVSTSPDFVYTPDNPQDGDTFRFYAIYEEFNSVTTKATPDQGGYIRPRPGTPYYYQIGRTVRVTATPREHWKFVKWIDEDGATLGTADLYEFIMPAYPPVYIEGIFEWDGTDLLVNSFNRSTPVKLVYDPVTNLLVADY